VPNFITLEGFSLECLLRGNFDIHRSFVTSFWYIYVCVCVRACVRVCVCEREREIGGRIFLLCAWLGSEIDAYRHFAHSL
jgi:hypothetical protein